MAAKKKVQDTQNPELQELSKQLSVTEAKARLERLRQRILAGEDFATLARANSDDKGSASQGGDLGWANPGTGSAISLSKPGFISSSHSVSGWCRSEKNRLRNTA